MNLTQTAIETLQKFEHQLNPQSPENGYCGVRIIGYGEMSTVFTFDDPELKDFAFKRMPIFQNLTEIDRYECNYLEYNELLNGLGLKVPEHGSFTISGKSTKVVLYLTQRILNTDCIGNKVIHRLQKEDSIRLFQAILEKFDVVFRHNQKVKEDRHLTEVGFDGQMSNWAIVNCDKSMERLQEKFELAYIDTSTPLMRKNGVEQLDPELFLRICPSSLVWIIKLFFLKDVLNRYYDLRLVIIDLIANLFKEKKEDLIQPFIEVANEYLQEKWTGIKPIQNKEITDYYKEDAMIWRLFLAFRKVERWIRLKRGKSYDLILPGNIER
ncbi:MAG: hypothetical protein H7A23_07480 [Leptospiraceae bacterium]|nr:hypothetical protein [Leptospiraceae bacterium]